MQNDIQKLEEEIMGLSQKLAKLRKESTPTPVKDYTFQGMNGTVSLLDLFSGKDTLLAIHNMGQGCRYCTLWGDGINGFLPHLEEAAAVVLLSKDAPELQRRFANSRGWRFRMASHGGTDYLTENMPGIVCYTRKGDQIFKKNSSIFGPGDQFCSIWHILSLAGHSEETWTPQYNYWKRPTQMDDGGKNVL